MTTILVGFSIKSSRPTTNEQFSLTEGGIPEGPRQPSVHAKSDNTWQAGWRAVIWLIIPD